MAAGAAAGDDGAGMAGRRQAVAQGVERCQALVRRAPALGEVHDVLHLTGIALQALEDEARPGGDDPGEGERAVGVEDAGTLLADVSVHEDDEDASGRPGCRPQDSSAFALFAPQTGRTPCRTRGGTTY